MTEENRRPHREEKTVQRTPKEFLAKYRDLGQSIDAKNQQILELRTQAVRLGSSNFGSRVQHTRNDRMSRAVAEIIDLMGEIEVEVLRRKTAMQEIERAIEQVEDGAQREVLRWRYLTNLNMEEIAGKMGYSRMQVSRIHGRALEAIRSMLEQKSGEETEKAEISGKGREE